MAQDGDIDYDDRKFTILHDFMSQDLSSLEEALSPLIDEIPNLKRYITEAKTSCCYPSKHGLTRDESASIYIYTMEWGKQSVYRVVNRALRTKDSNRAKPWYSYLKLYITALLKLPVYNGNVWRGENHNIAQRLQKNQKCIWWPITSTSVTTDVMDDFIRERGSILLIEAKNARSIIGYSFHPQEEEVILLPGTSVSVLNSPFHDCSDLYVVSLKVVNENELLRDYNTSSLNSSPSTILDIRPIQPRNDRHSPIQNNRKSSAQRELRTLVQNDPSRSTRIDKPLPTREPQEPQKQQEPISCGGHACKRCQKCSDWKWNNRSNDWNRASDATCRGAYTVDENKHYVRGIGGGRGGGGIYPLCECDA